MIAVGGSFGTLAEMAFALRLGRPVVGIGGPSIDGVPSCSDPAEAVSAVLAALADRASSPPAT